MATIQRTKIVPFKTSAKKVISQPTSVPECDLALVVPSNLYDSPLRKELPREYDLKNFIQSYLDAQEELKEHKCTVDPETKYLNIPILDQHKHIRFRFGGEVNPAQPLLVTSDTKINNICVIWNPSKDIDIIRCLDIYHALVLLRLESAEPLPLLYEEHLSACPDLDEEVKKVLTPYTKCPSNTNSIAKRGVIITGPPGTGKTARMKNFLARPRKNVFLNARHSEMKPYDTNIGVRVVWYGVAANFNSKHVGESEQKIRNIADIARANPHLLCVMLVDEAEVLLGDRDSGGEDYKKDRLTVVLSVFKGIEDTPNLLLWASTNLVGSLDDATYRRFSVQFKGRMGFYERIAVFQLQDDGEYDFFNFHVTVNFTIDQMNRWQWFLQWCHDKTHQGAIIKFLEEECSKETGLEFNRELVQCKYNPSLFFDEGIAKELLFICRMEGNWRFSTISGDDITILSTFEESALPVPKLCFQIYKYCVSRCPIIDHIALINNDVVISSRKSSSNNQTEETQIARVIDDIYEEYRHYQNSCLILDLDELIGVSREISSTTGNTKNVLSNPNLRRDIKNRTEHRAEELSTNTGQNIMHRFCGIVTGTNTSAAMKNARITNEQNEVSNLIQLDMNVGVGQEQVTESTVSRPMRPLVLNIICNLIKKAHVYPKLETSMIFVLIVRDKDLFKILNSHL